MPPPPVTPSPHRFLAKTQHKSTKPNPNDTKTPGSKLKYKTLATPEPQHTTPKAIPRFSAPGVEARTPAFKTRVGDAESPASVPITENDTPKFAATPKFGYSRPSSPKRPRLQHSEDENVRFATPRRFRDENANVVIEEAEFAHPPQFIHAAHVLTEDAPLAQVTCRSLLPPIAYSTNTSGAAQETTQIEPSSPILPLRPVFLPPLEPQHKPQPLPEAFSPHRKGQKFLPGGMADEVRQWILDTSTTQTWGRRGGDEGWSVKVAEVGGGAGVRMLLGEGGEGIVLPGAGGKGRDVEVGCVIRVKGGWDVEVKEQMWRVAVEWSVIQNG